MGVAFAGKCLTTSSLNFSTPTAQHVGIYTQFSGNLSLGNAGMCGQLNRFTFELVLILSAL